MSGLSNFASCLSVCVVSYTKSFFQLIGLDVKSQSRLLRFSHVCRAWQYSKACGAVAGEACAGRGEVCGV